MCPKGERILDEGFVNYTEEEAELIRKYYEEGKPDEEIAAKLNRTKASVASKRISMGLMRAKKHLPRGTSLTKEERKKLEIKRYRLSPRYKGLSEILSEEEKKVFDEEFELFLNGVDEVDARDVENIHMLVMEIIMQNKLLRKQKRAEDEDREIDIEKDYNSSVARYERLLRMLNMSRQQRLEKHRKVGISITDLIELLDKKENLEKIQSQEKLIHDEVRDFRLSILHSQNSDIFGMEKFDRAQLEIGEEEKSEKKEKDENKEADGESL